LKINRHNLNSRILWIILTLAAACFLSACGGGSSDTNPVVPRAPLSNAPVIVTQPTNQILNSIGSTTTFSVVASGEAPLSYQWKRDGVDINGATAASYMLTETLMSDTSSRWSVLVRNSKGTAISNDVKITMAAISIFAGSVAGEGNVDGRGSSASFFYPTGVAVDRQGNTYIADAGNRTIRKISAVGLVTTFAGNPLLDGANDGLGTLSSFSRPVGLTVDAAGNVYVTDNKDRSIRKISPAGFVTTMIGKNGSDYSLDGNIAQALIGDPTGVAVDPAGNVYVTDTNNHTIRKISLNGQVTTFAGSSGVAGSTDGRGAEARFDRPTGIAADAAGNLYVVDSGNTTIRKISSDGMVTVFAGSPHSVGTLDGRGTAAKFFAPICLATDAIGNVYVIDRLPSSIMDRYPTSKIDNLRKISPDGQVTSLLVSGDLRVSFGIAIDKAGNILVADQENHIIRKVSTDGLVVSILAGSILNSGSADGVGIKASFGYLGDITADVAGNVYVIDAENRSLRKINSIGQVTTPVKNLSLKPDEYLYFGFFRYCNFSCKLAIDVGNNAYVTDNLNHRVLKISSTGLVTTLAGNLGVWGAADGLGTAATFSYPGDIAVDTAGNVYVADGNQTIRTISPLGLVKTLAGSPGLEGYSDGQGADARFDSINGIAVDAVGNVYLIDTRKCTIRKISSTGLVTTLAGKPQTTGGYPIIVDGLGAEARFQSLTALTIDSSGNLYVVDSNTIRKINPAGLVTTIVGKDSSQGISLESLLGSRGGITGIAIDANNVLYVSTRKGVLRIA
jgi:sugar lactone lactonase YvrE